MVGTNYFAKPKISQKITTLYLTNLAYITLNQVLNTFNSKTTQLHKLDRRIKAANMTLLCNWPIQVKQASFRLASLAHLARKAIGASWSCSWEPNEPWNPEGR